MQGEPTTPDPVQVLVRALNARDFDAAADVYLLDAVFERDIEVLEGRQAIRSFFEDWMAPYADFKIEVQEAHDLGKGVTLHILRQGGRLAGGQGRVELVRAYVESWADGRIQRMTSYPDIDRGRASAERLGQGRG